MDVSEYIDLSVMPQISIRKAQPSQWNQENGLKTFGGGFVYLVSSRVKDIKFTDEELDARGLISPEKYRLERRSGNLLYKIQVVGQDLGREINIFVDESGNEDFVPNEYRRTVGEDPNPLDITGYNNHERIPYTIDNLRDLESKCLRKLEAIAKNAGDLLSYKAPIIRGFEKSPESL